jgi:hypothetical protein
MDEAASDSRGTKRATCEVVGVLPSPAALEAAVEQLGIAGVDRAAISVLSTDGARSGRIADLYRSATEIVDDPAARQAAFVSQGARTEGAALAIAFPAQIGGFAGAWAVAATGGALLLGIGAVVAGGAIGAGIGALIYGAVAHRHAAAVEHELALGGFVLWVSTPDAAAEARAMAVLQRCGGSSIHTHVIEREWGVADVPLHDAQPDPFLVHEPDPAAPRGGNGTT